MSETPCRYINGVCPECGQTELPPVTPEPIDPLAVLRSCHQLRVRGIALTDTEAFAEALARSALHLRELAERADVIYVDWPGEIIRVFGGES